MWWQGELLTKVCQLGKEEAAIPVGSTLPLSVLNLIIIHTHISPPHIPHYHSHIPHYHSSTLRTALQSLELAVDKVSLIANTLNQPDISDEVSGIPHLTLLVPTDDIIIPHLTLSSDDVIIPHLTLCILLMMSSFLI